MNNTNGSDDWRVLCELASKDPEKLVDLVVKINRALEECHQGSLNYGPEVNIETVVPPKGSRDPNVNLYSYGITSQCFMRLKYNC